jgi:hypothetical protein
MAVPYLIEMVPHPATAIRRTSNTHWQVTRGGAWLGDFENADLAQIFVNAMTYIEEVKVCGHLDAYPACEYLLRNTITKGIPP